MAPSGSEQWAADPKKKKKEEAFLNRTKLCTYNFSNSCRDGPHCNFAHSLDRLLLPEECMGNWSDTWQNGDVDMNFWHNYIPNKDSLARFTKQFFVGV